MKIALCTNGDFIGNILTNEIVKNFKYDKIFVFIDTKPIKKAHVSHLDELKFGTEDIFDDYISPMVEKMYKSKKNLQDKSKYLTYNQLSEYCSNLSLYRIKNINSKENYKLLKKINPDVIISFRFKTIFKQHIIDIPKFGIANIHSGVLPQFRGIYSLVRALNRGVKKFGCTLHFVNDEGIDTGNIIEKKDTKIDINRSYSYHVIKMFDDITPVAIRFLNNLKNKKSIISKKQNEKLSHYYSVPHITEMNKLKTNMPIIFEKRDLDEIIKRYL